MKIFTDVIEPSTLSKLYDIEKSGIYDHIRVMPDVCDGESIVGFTGYFKDRLSPDVIGPDIGCGVLVVELTRKQDIDVVKLDKVIHNYIPSGSDVCDRNDKFYNKYKLRLGDLYCYEYLNRVLELERAMGTLGGGNHFIELDKDNEGRLYLLIHTGSRNLGKQIWQYYKNRTTRGYLSDDEPGMWLTQYLSDCRFANTWARENRFLIAEKILNGLKIPFNKKHYNYFDCPHNYINGLLIRKGAIEATKCKDVIIPINMRDGALLCKGKYNEDWNYSAPHGAGRLLSRSQARKQLSLDEYKKEMEGIYTTSVNNSTLDESPMAYKNIADIIDKVEDAVEIKKIIKPIYNFKNSSGNE